LFHVWHCVSPVYPNGSLLCSTFRASWKFLFFLPSRVFLLSASSTTMGLYKEETKKGENHGLFSRFSLVFVPRSMNNKAAQKEKKQNRLREIRGKSAIHPHECVLLVACVVWTCRM
jgi:hypothetical protein